jgi:hypothetical protein
MGMVALIVLGFMGCAPTKPWESRQPKTGALGATLVNPSDSQVWILTLDGEREGLPSHGHYRLEPGRHTVRAQYFWTQSYVTWLGDELVEDTFEAQPGAILRVMVEHQEGSNYKGTWKFWIEDAATHMVVSEAPIVTRGATGELQDPPFFHRFPFWP